MKNDTIMPWDDADDNGDPTQLAEETNGVTNVASDNISPFDRIKHEDEHGEYWEARELQTLLGYTEWRNFKKAMDKAIENYNALEMTTEYDFVEANKIVEAGATAKPVIDYRLTRRACYTIAINCDPSKTEVAAAKQYFVVKTREAEVTQQHSAYPEMSQMEMIAAIATEAVKTEKRLKALEVSKAEHDQRLELIDSSTQEISERTATLEVATGLVTPELPNSSRNKRLNGMIYTIGNGDQYQMSELKNGLILYIESQFHISITTQLTIWRQQLSAYYGSLKGRGITPPISVPRPSKIKDITWIQLVAAKATWYQAAVSWLDSQR